jgi:hypothetical protein
VAAAYFYVAYALQRWTGATRPNPLGILQWHVALIWLEGTLLISAYYVGFHLFGRELRVDAVVAALIVALPLAWGNNRALSKDSVLWQEHRAVFAKYDRAKRRILDICVALLLVVIIFVIPPMVKYLRLGYV